MRFLWQFPEDNFIKRSGGWVKLLHIVKKFQIAVKIGINSNRIPILFSKWGDRSRELIGSKTDHQMVDDLIQGIILHQSPTPLIFVRSWGHQTEIPPFIINYQGTLPSWNLYRLKHPTSTFTSSHRYCFIRINYHSLAPHLRHRDLCSIFRHLHYR